MDYAMNLKVAFIGWGAINTRVGELLKHRAAKVDVVGIARRTRPDGATVPHLAEPDMLKDLGAELVVEAAGREVLRSWAPHALRHCRALAVASTSAFTDDRLLSDLCEIAATHGSRILIPSGAIGAIDALTAAATLPLDEVVHQVIKPPQAWKNTRAEQLIDLDGLTARHVFFTGSARDAAEQFPQNANATVVTSLAGVGPDRTRVELVADPDSKLNQHRISARGAFGNFDILLNNQPLATNPKSSELTALSLVRLVEQQTAVLTI
jgi:aspartate dehydrogenase